MKDHIIPLISILTKRDIIGKYRRATLGSLYAIIQPVGYMLTFLLLGKVVGVNSEGIPYIIMLLTGLVPWLFFSNAINSFSTVIQVNADLIKKMPITKEIFLIVVLLVSFVDFLISSIVLLFFSIWYQLPITISLLWLPLIIGILILFMIGLGFIVATMGTIRTDIQFLLPFLLQLWMFASPVIYPLSQVPSSVRDLYILNPMTGIIEAIRTVISFGHSPDLSLLGISFVYVVIINCIGWPIFRHYSMYFSDVM